MAMKWTTDGDQQIATGTLGKYTITEWMASGGSNFVIGFQSKSRAGRKGIGEFSTLANAKRAAEIYDGYRNTPSKPT